MKKIDELRLLEFQSELAKIDADELSDYKYSSSKISPLLSKIIEEYPLEMTFSLCEGICQAGDIAEHPFKEVFDNATWFSRWYDLAEITLNGINAHNEDYGNEYISLVQFIGRELDLNVDDIFNAKRECELDELRSGQFLNFIKCLLKRIEDRLKNILFHFSWMVYRGLPFYEKNAHDGFSIVHDTNHDYVYLFMNGFYTTSPAMERNSGGKYKIRFLPRYPVPAWVKKYYLNNYQLAAFNELYSNQLYVLDDEQTIQLRRTAFRKTIGEKDVFICAYETNNSALNSASDHHDTKLMRIQKKVIERFYGDLFVKNEPDSWTKQTVVVDWLRQEFNLSDREAKAIDMITRPDIARGK